MRKIEKDMNHAIAAGLRTWKSGNTSVETASNDCRRVYLHGHHIATVYPTAGGFGVKANKETLRNWPTATTKSRLRALGVNVHTRAHVTYLNDEAI